MGQARCWGCLAERYLEVEKHQGLEAPEDGRNLGGAKSQGSWKAEDGHELSIGCSETLRTKMLEKTVKTLVLVGSETVGLIDSERGDRSQEDCSDSF